MKNPHEAQYNVFAATHDAMPDVPKTHVIAAFDAAWAEFSGPTVFICGQSERDLEREFKRINRKVREEVSKVYPVGFLDVWGWFQLIRLVAMVVQLVWEHKRDAAHT